MAIKSYFFNAVLSGGVYDRTYNAEDVTSYLDKILGNGVFPNPSTSLQVTATGSGLNVSVAAGQGWINGHKLINTSALTLTLSSLSGAFSGRYDRVIFYVDTTEREMGIEVLEGTEASVPTAPSLTQTSTRYELSLALILVSQGVSTLTNSYITDTRADTDVCGWVTGLVDQVDTSTLYTQYEAAYAEQLATMQTWYESMQSQFEAWLDSLTEQLTVQTYLRFYSKNVTGTASAISPITLDMDGYTYDASDVIIVFINGLAATPGTDFTRYTSSGSCKITLTTLDSASTNNDINIYVFKSKIGFSNLITSDDDDVITDENDNIVI